MKVFISQYGKAALYIIIATMVVIPLLFLSLNTYMKDITYDQSTNVNRDNSYLLAYEAPKIVTDEEYIKVQSGSKVKDLDFKSLFNVKATVNSGKISIDKNNIECFLNVNEKQEILKPGIYIVTFSCEYIYDTADGNSIPRDSTLNVRVVVE